MARLPNPGGDNGNWGTILNDYLSQSHAADGTLKPSVVQASNLVPGTATTGQVLTYDSAAAGKLTWTTPQGGGASPATTSALGTVQLAGDLGGTAAAPTVPGLASKYTKPAGGIPAADLAGGITTTQLDTATQSALGKAGTSVQSINGKTPNASGVVTLTAGDLGVSGGATALSALSDVTIPTPQDRQVLSYDAATGKWIAGVVTSAVVSPATNLALGTVQLAGDLGGTAAAPTVPTKADKATTVTGTKSLSGGGDLSANRTLELVGDSAAPGSSRYYGTDGTGGKGWYALPSGGGGEVNTASNIGTAGVGVYKQKTGVNLELKKLNAGSNKVTLTDNTANNTIDIDVATANLGLTKSSVGLANVDNTSDANKPVSSATQAALDGKVSQSSFTTKGDILVGTGVGTYARVGVGSNGQTLTTDSSVASGMKWDVPEIGAGLITGLDASATADNTTIIQAAIDARRTSLAGALLLPRGTWRITGRITLYDGMSLVGESSSDSYSATELICAATSAGIDVIGSGGYLQDIEINGNDIATNPLKFGEGADRTVLRVNAHNAAQDNVIIEYLQNSSFISCTFNRSGRDGIVLDKESGGIHFLRSNVSNPGRYGIRIDQSVAPTTAYTQPQHIRFSHSLVERPTTNNSLVYINSGFFIVFDTCIFAAGAAMISAPMMTNKGSNITVDTCEWSGAGISNIVAIDNIASARMSINGTQWLISTAFFINNPSGTVQVNGDVFLNGGVFVTTNTPSNGDINVISETQTATISVRPNTGAIVMKGRVSSEAGERFRIFADGRVSWSDGSNYAFNTSIYRRGDGKLGIDGGMATGGDLHMTSPSARAGFFGANPITKPSVSGSKAGNAALDSLLTQLANLGLIDNQTTS